jgi:hypothetical protein
MTSAMVLGSGPSKDMESFRDFNGIRIICDKEYHNCAVDKIPVDYAITLEDGDLSHYFTPPHVYQNGNKPIVVISNRIHPNTKKVIDEQDFLTKLYTNEILNICYSVGTMAWMFAWEKLGADTITLNGFDSLQQYAGYDLLHHLWRDMFWELHDDYCPKNVKTIFTDYKDTQVQREKDSLSLDRSDTKYPGFDDFKTYIRYREERNNVFLHKLKVWER